MSHGEAKSTIGEQSARGEDGAAPGGARQDRYRALFENSADAILIIEGETFVDCNQATVEMLRYRGKAELLKTHPSELSPPTQPDGRSSFEKANEMIEIAFREGSHRFEWNHQRADGEVFPVEVLLTAVPEGEKSTLHVVWRDITARRLLEERLRHTQKMEAIGMLAGGIAHDFNNLLVAITGNAELLASECSDSPERAELAEEILQAATRASSLTRQLLTFSRKQVLQPAVVDLNQKLAELGQLLRRILGEDLRIETRLGGGELELLIDPGQLEQVIINLVTNARDAMPNGGTVTIETSTVRLAEDAIGAPPDLASGDYVQLTISDTGCGMSEEVAKRAFDPFFTTKPIGEGTGLGLSTAYGVVKQSHGELSLRTVPGRGTTITILLPSSREAASTEHERLEAAPAPRGRGETVLVVEDEPAVSTVVAKVLRHHGYDVLMAANGAEALEYYRGGRPRQIDLILSDVVMPEMGGPELVAALREEGHEPRVLFVSGYLDPRIPSVGRLAEAANLLKKPFTTGDLLLRVRRALDRG